MKIIYKNTNLFLFVTDLQYDDLLHRSERQQGLRFSRESALLPLFLMCGITISENKEYNQSKWDVWSSLLNGNSKVSQTSFP